MINVISKKLIFLFMKMATFGGANLDTKEKMLLVWERAFGKNGKNNQKDSLGYKIMFSYYNKDSNCGWCADHIVPVSYLKGWGVKDLNYIKNLQPMQYRANYFISDKLENIHTIFKETNGTIYTKEEIVNTIVEFAKNNKVSMETAFKIVINHLYDNC